MPIEHDSIPLTFAGGDGMGDAAVASRSSRDAALSGRLQ